MHSKLISFLPHRSRIFIANGALIECSLGAKWLEQHLRQINLCSVFCTRKGARNEEPRSIATPEYPQAASQPAVCVFIHYWTLPWRVNSGCGRSSDVSIPVFRNLDYLVLNKTGAEAHNSLWCYPLSYKAIAIVVLYITERTIRFLREWKLDSYRTIHIRLFTRLSGRQRKLSKRCN